MQIRFASSITNNNSVDRAINELIEPVDHRVTPGMVDLAMLFATSHFRDDLPKVVDRLSDTFGSAMLLGCTAEGTIGSDRELERIPSMSLLVASLPDVAIRPFHMTQANLEGISKASDWENLVAVAPESNPTFIGLADPFTMPAHEFVEELNDAYPGAPLVGGVASGAREPHQNRLLVGDQTFDHGMVGVALSGPVTVTTVVSQGCRPIGSPFVITKGERNLIHELGGRLALEQLHKVFMELPETDAKLARESLFVGRVINEYKERFGRGDFLIHNIMGADRDTGAIGIAGQARVGTTVQFHVRDAKSADEDLRALLQPCAGSNIEGALLFGCNGRGSRMWDEPGHDVTALRETLGDIPVAGFFAGGEFGPVGGKNFVHGFTASIALFSDANAESDPNPESNTDQLIDREDSH